MSAYSATQPEKLSFIAKKLLPLHSRRWLTFRALLTREQNLQAGTISVIVPMYNVAEFLFDALSSIRYQRYPSLDVILVDDGSTDRSGEIAEHFVHEDSRFKLLRTDRVGPGAARNEGLRAAQGDYIAFVDGDDILPLGAFYRLITSLCTSGSDFVVGSFDYFDETIRRQPRWAKTTHSKPLYSVSLDELPSITRNVFPWNKLFRREFFESHIKAFPEGILYEDQVPTALAYTRSKCFDVSSDTVYLWRRRYSNDSITQNRGSLTHLQNRLRVMIETGRIYRAHGNPDIYNEWLRKSLYEDLVPFFRQTAIAEHAYRELLVRACRLLREAVPESHHLLASDREKALVASVLKRDFPQLAKMLA